MSEMHLPANGSGKTAHAATRTMSPRVDLTPMVDLGFLLLAFFVFTATLHQPVVKPLFLPADNPPGLPTPKVPASRTITLIPQGVDQVSFFEGIAPVEKADMQSINTNNLRHFLLEKQKQLIHKGGMIAIIRPDSSCSYGLLVSLLDELVIVGCQKYVLTDDQN